MAATRRHPLPRTSILQVWRAKAASATLPSLFSTTPNFMDKDLDASKGTNHSLPTDPIPSGSTAGNTSQKNTTSPTITGSRHSPVTPLAPLEYLQNQRRGSITDPSLHAGPTSHSHLTNSAAANSIPSFRQRLNSGPGSNFPVASTSHEPHTRGPLALPRPSSPYKFGDAESVNANDRRPLRSSPSTDAGGRRTPSGGKRGSESAPEQSTSGAREERAITGNTNTTIHMHCSLAYLVFLYRFW